MFAIQQASPFGAFVESSLHARGADSLVVLVSYNSSEGLRRLTDTGSGFTTAWQYESSTHAPHFCRSASRIFTLIRSGGAQSLHCLDFNGNLQWSTTPETRGGAGNLADSFVVCRGSDVWEFAGFENGAPQLYRLRRYGADGTLKWTYTDSPAAFTYKFTLFPFVVLPDGTAVLDKWNNSTSRTDLRLIDGDGSFASDIAHYNLPTATFGGLGVHYSPSTGDLYWRWSNNVGQMRLSRVTTAGAMVWENSSGITATRMPHREMYGSMWGGLATAASTNQANTWAVSDGSHAFHAIAADSVGVIGGPGGGVTGGFGFDMAPGGDIYAAFQSSIGNELSRFNATALTETFRAGISTLNPALIRSTAE